MFSWFEALLDSPMWYLPGLRRVAEARSLSAQLPLWQAAVKAGHDLPQAAGQAASVAANVYSRQRQSDIRTPPPDRRHPALHAASARCTA